MYFIDGAFNKPFDGMYISIKTLLHVHGALNSSEFNSLFSSSSSLLIHMHKLYSY